MIREIKLNNITIADWCKINLFIGKNELMSKFWEKLEYAYLNENDTWEIEYSDLSQKDNDTEILNHSNFRLGLLNPLHFIDHDYFEGNTLTATPCVSHRSKFTGMWKRKFVFQQTISKICFYRTQSIDVIRTFVEVAQEINETDIRLFRLAQKDGEIKVFESTREGIKFAHENNWEISL
jgi:hypothetical protein